MIAIDMLRPGFEATLGGVHALTGVLRSLRGEGAKPDARKRLLHSGDEDNSNHVVAMEQMHEYKLEFELREPVVSWLTQSLGCDVVADEIVLGGGYPDLVATTSDRLTRRELQDMAPYIVIEDFMRAVDDPLAQPIDAFGNLVAVELKLRDWRKAIRQASRYRTFASASYVALPVERVTDGAVGFARECGVGILGVCGNVEVLLAANTGLPHDPVQKSWASELIFAQLSGVRPAARLAGMAGGKRLQVAR